MKPGGASSSKPPAKRLYRRCWFRLVGYVAAAYIAWCAVLYFYQDKMIFPADMAPPPGPAAVRSTVPVTRLQLDLETGGRVEAWYIPAPEVSLENPGPAVVFFHGNAEIIDYQDHIVGGYRRLGCSMLLPEYRGYGRSAGKPSEKALVADAVRFYDQLVTREDVDASRIVFHGRSLGGGVAAQLAARRKPAALILESTFRSLAIMAHEYFVPSFLARHPLRTDRVVPEIDVPLLILHGANDTIIPVTHGRKLRDLAPPGTIYVEYDCGHNDFPGRGNRDAYWNQIAKFLIAARVVTTSAIVCAPPIRCPAARPAGPTSTIGPTTAWAGR